MKKFLSLAAIAVAGTIMLSGCATRAAPDEIILYYKAGVGDNREFVECIEPSQSGKYPIDDEVFSLPTNNRTWNVIPKGGDSNTPFVASAKPTDSTPGIEVKIYASIEFVLNTNCDEGKNSPIVQFWEKVGHRYDAHTPDGWLDMMKNTFVSVETEAFNTEVKRFSADELRYDLDNTKEKLRNLVVARMKIELEKKIGAKDIFCGTSFDRTTTKCPDFHLTITDVFPANPDIQKSMDAVHAASEAAKAALIEAQSKVDVARKTAEATALNKDYIRLQELETQLEIAKEQTRMAEKCAANQNCTVIVGGNANVFPGR